MQKVLILSSNPVETGDLETFLAERNALVKVVTDHQLAKEWLEQRSYDIFIVTDEISEKVMRELGAVLWASNAAALALTTRMKGEFQNPDAFYRMLGYGPLTYEKLVEAIEEITPTKDDVDGERFPVLVVEDLDSPRDIICIFIESLGYSEVIGCSSASEALKLLEDDPTKFGCVVTDIRMPKISGKEMTEIIRSHDKLQHLPIIVLTAYGTLDMLVDCLRVGASGFLVKPPKKEDMLRELSRAVRIYQKKESPRLASLQEAEYIRDMVESNKVT